MEILAAGSSIGALAWNRISVIGGFGGGGEAQAPMARTLPAAKPVAINRRREILTRKDQLQRFIIENPLLCAEFARYGDEAVGLELLYTLAAELA